MIDDEKNLVEKIWQEINQGNDFLVVAKRYYTDLVPVKDIEVGKLTPEVAAVVQKIEIGEVAPPFAGKGDRVMLVKLLDRKPGDTKPFESVKGDILRELMPKKYKQLKQEYIEKVVAYSEIEINQKAWDKLIADQTK